MQSKLDPHVQFQVNYHASLTEEGCPETPKINSGDLLIIVTWNVSSDIDQFDSAIHFDNCCFELGAQRIADLWTAIAGGNQVFPNFGTLLHTVQDFYSHSNWVELHQDQAPIPVWDLSPGSLPGDIVSGTFWLDSPKLCGPNAPSHEQLNKDSPTTPEGSKIVVSGPNAGKSLFDLAYACALAATVVQFDRLIPLLPPPS